MRGYYGELPRYLENENDKAVNILNALFKDMLDRRGFRQNWEQIDEDIQLEIIETWYKLIQDVIGS